MTTELYRCTLEVRWRDLDAFNHVNNASYLGYIEEARVRWFKSLAQDWDGDGAAPIMAAVTVNYRKSITWPETITVELFAERLGGKSLTVGHRVRSASNPDVLYCDGHTVLVWVERNGQTVAIPEAVRAACVG